MEPRSLSEELKNLKSEVVSMKRVMVDSFAFENQFLKIKQQLAEIIDEISTIKSTVAVRQQTVKNEKDAPAKTLNCSSSTQCNISKSHSFLALDEQLKGQWLTIGIVKENFSKLQQDVIVQSLKSTENSKILQSVIEQQKYMEEQINLLHAKLDQDSQTQHKTRKQFTQNIRNFLKALKHKEKNNRANKTLRRVKKLECKVAISLRNGGSFIEDIVEKRMQFLTESVEDNTYDTQQCWKMLEEIQEAEHYFMLNGDKVKLEDTMSQLIFGQETLLALSEEQMNSIVKIQDDISGKSISEMFGWNFSHKDLLSSLKDVGDKYEMMKVLILKRFEGLDACLDRSKNFGNILNIMAKSRQVLEKQVDLLKNDVDRIKESRRDQNVNIVVKLRKFPIRNAKGTPFILNAPSSQDSIMWYGRTRIIDARHQCITAMTIYENKSLEELRHLDYSEMDAEIKSEYQTILSPLSPFTSFGNQVSQVADPSLSTSQFKLPSTPLFQLPSNTKLWSWGFNTTTPTTSTATATYSPLGINSSSFVPFITSASPQISPSPGTIPRRVARRPARRRVKKPTANPASVISSLFTNPTISGASSKQVGSTTTVSGLFGPTSSSTGLFGSTTTSSGLFGQSITSSGLFGPTSSSSGLFGSTTTSSGPSTTSSGLFGSTTSSSGLFGPHLSSTGRFGSTSSSDQSTTSSGLLGQTSSSSGIIGSSISSSVFGQSALSFSSSNSTGTCISSVICGQSATSLGQSTTATSTSTTSSK